MLLPARSCSFREITTIASCSGWLEQRALAGRRPLRLADRRAARHVARVGAPRRAPRRPRSACPTQGLVPRRRLRYPRALSRPPPHSPHVRAPGTRAGGAHARARPALPDPLDAPGQAREPDSPDDYERSPLRSTAFLFALAQAGAAQPAPGRTPSKRVWDALSGGEGTAGRIRGWLLGSVALPGAVGVANRLGLGPVRADLRPGR